MGLFLLCIHLFYILSVVCPSMYTHPSYSTILIYIYVFLCDGIILFTLTKYWLLSFQLKYAKSKIDQQWKYHLDPNLSQLKNHAVTIKLILLLWVVLFTIHFAIMFLALPDDPRWTENILFVFNLYNNLLIMLFAGYLYSKSPSFLDIFELNTELKAVLWIVSILIPIDIVGNLVFIFYVDNHHKSIYSKFFQSIFDGFNIYLYLLCSTWLILKKLKTPKVSEESYANLFGLTSIELVPTKPDSLHINDILINSHKDHGEFHLFVYFLCLEYCKEVLVSFIEFLQFKYRVYELFKEQLSVYTETSHIQLRVDVITSSAQSDDSTQSEPEFDASQLDISINKFIPKSAIIYDKFDVDSEQKANLELACQDSASQEMNSKLYPDESKIEPLLIMAHRLYDKYINMEEETELTINISGELRNIYKDQMGIDMKEFVNMNRKMELRILWKYFDPIINEMYVILTDSYNRFLTQNTREIVAKIMIPDLINNDDHLQEQIIWT